MSFPALSALPSGLQNGAEPSRACRAKREGGGSKRASAALEREFFFLSLFFEGGGKE